MVDKDIKHDERNRTFGIVWLPKMGKRKKGHFVSYLKNLLLWMLVDTHESD